MAGFDPSQIRPMDKTPEEETITAMVYGDPGVGKTTFVSYAPSLLLIETERGETSIYKTPNRPDLVHADTLDELAEIYLWLHTGNHNYKSVAIDTLTEASKRELARITHESSLKIPDKDPDRPTMPDYGKLSSRMSKMVRAFRDLPMHTFFLCHTRSDKDEETGAVKVTPNLTPAVMSDAVAYCNAVFYLDVDKNGARTVRTQPSRKYIAKHRLGDLPDVVKFLPEELCRVDVFLDAMLRGIRFWEQKGDELSSKKEEKK